MGHPCMQAVTTPKVCLPDQKHFALVQDDGSLVLLDPVPYGQQGPWAVNMWFKATDISGTSLQYLYAHAASNNYAADSFYPNQVHFYSPAKFLWNPDFFMLHSCSS